MSKHHQSHRRRSYGRRQHEVRERPAEARTTQPVDLDETLPDERGQAMLHFEGDIATRRLSFLVSD